MNTEQTEMETKNVATEDTASSGPVLPADHPLASIAGSANSEPLWEQLWEEIRATRRRLDERERERIDREILKDK